MKPASSSRVLTLERGLQILEHIIEKKNVTVTGVAQVFRIQKSASHRFLNTLRYMGYVEQSKQNDYVLSSRIRNLGQGIVPKVELRNLTRHYLEELFRNAGLPSNLGYWDGHEITYLAQKVTSSKIEGYAEGNRIPAYCSAMGKAVLAFSPQAEIDNYLHETALVRFTPTTICDPSELAEELRTIRNQGYALMREEMAAHLIGLAAPIFNKEGYPRYAISIAGLYFSNHDEYFSRFRDDVVRVAHEISDILTHCRTMEDN